MDGGGMLRICTSDGHTHWSDALRVPTTYSFLQLSAQSAWHSHTLPHLCRLLQHRSGTHLYKQNKHKHTHLRSNRDTARHTLPATGLTLCLSSTWCIERGIENQSRDRGVNGVGSLQRMRKRRVEWKHALDKLLCCSMKNSSCVFVKEIQWIPDFWRLLFCVCSPKWYIQSSTVKVATEREAYRTKMRDKVWSWHRHNSSIPPLKRGWREGWRSMRGHSY